MEIQTEQTEQAEQTKQDLKPEILEDFLLKISKKIEKDIAIEKSLIKDLFYFYSKINDMNANELISLFQSLKTLKDFYPWKINKIFRQNPVRINIEKTQIFVIEAMKEKCKRNYDLTVRFNSVIWNTWINGNECNIPSNYY